MTRAERALAWAALLESHPRVSSARPLPGPGDRIAVVPAVGADETVDGWSYLFEDLYGTPVASGRGSGSEDPDPRLVGWIDGLTGAEVPGEQMREWVGATVDRVRALRPRTVLEIGAGTGLVMDGLLRGGGPGTYVATDLARASLDALRGIADRAGPGTRVEVHQHAAHEDLPVPPGPGYDTVVLNSVVQYFPGTAYLEDVVSRAVAVTAPGGHVFLGDLRDATTLPHYYRARQEDGTVAFDLERHQRRDFELSLSPDHVGRFAEVLDRVTAVEVAPRRGIFRNEMSVYRFDAVLHVGCPPPERPPRGTGPGGPLAAVARHLTEGGGPAVWRGVRNARLGPAEGCADPESLWGLGTRRGWRVRVGCEPGRGTASLEVWAAPVGTADDHFRLSLPHRGGTVTAHQPPLPPGRAWPLVEALRRHVREASEGAAPPGGPLPDIQLVCDTGATGQE
ncbi:class I SAM-dependent methyltransferase [Streptomyces sp. JNUCC 64]